MPVTIPVGQVILSILVQIWIPDLSMAVPVVVEPPIRAITGGVVGVAERDIKIPEWAGT